MEARSEEFQAIHTLVSWLRLLAVVVILEFVLGLNATVVAARAEFRHHTKR